MFLANAANELSRDTNSKEVLFLSRHMILVLRGVGVERNFHIQNNVSLIKLLNQAIQVPTSLFKILLGATFVFMSMNVL